MTGRLSPRITLLLVLLALGLFLLPWLAGRYPVYLAKPARVPRSLVKKIETSNDGKYAPERPSNPWHLP